MLRMPRLLPSRSMQCLALACSLSLPFSFVGRSLAQDAPPATPPATPAPAAPAPATPAAGDSITPAAPPADAAAAAPAPVPAVDLPANEELKDSVESFWHFAKIARYPVAVAEGKRILDSNTDPVLLLDMFQTVATRHFDNLDISLIRWQGVPEMTDTATQLIATLNKGHEARKADPKFIEDSIKLLSENERGYDLAIDRLRDSGELAVPIMIDDLRDPSKSGYHASIRRALRDLGLAAVNPLLAATEMKDQQTLMTVVDVLGDLGYDVAVPYLSHVLQGTDAQPDVKAAVGDSLRHLRVVDPGLLNTPSQFYQLAEKFYYDHAAVRAEKKDPIARIWYWTDSKGLTFIAVPQPIFHDVMAKREAEYALKFSQPKSPIADDALAIWLSANYQDESDLPAGQKDPTLAADAPSAHYWGALSGTKYLNNALSRANKDRNAPVARGVIVSLQDIGGQANLFNGTDHPLMDAMQFQDRLVRYEAAFALAKALPRQSFIGEERVVPLLAEALSQSGAANVLVLAQSQDQLNAIVGGLKGQGYNAVGGITPAEAVANSASRPSIDAIVTSDDESPAQVQELQVLALQSPRLQRAVKVISTRSKASPYAVEAASDTSLSTTQAKLNDFPAIKVAIDDARKRGGLLPLDEATSTKYATTAADLLAKIAINHSPVYDVTVALPLMYSSLEDARPDIVKNSAMVLSLIDSNDTQSALLAKATEEKTTDDLKVILYKALATNARNFGKRLNDDQVMVLQKVVGTAANLEVRTAAGEARGSLDLPADQAKKLIVDQAKTSQ